VAGGRHFRVAPCSGGISGMDHGAEEYADGFFFLLTLLGWARFIDETESASDSAIKSA